MYAMMAINYGRPCPCAHVRKGQLGQHGNPKEPAGATGKSFLSCTMCCSAAAPAAQDSTLQPPHLPHVLLVLPRTVPCSFLTCPMYCCCCCPGKYPAASSPAPCTAAAAQDSTLQLLTCPMDGTKEAKRLHSWREILVPLPPLGDSMLEICGHKKHSTSMRKTRLRRSLSSYTPHSLLPACSVQLLRAEKSWLYIQKMNPSWYA